MMMRPRKNRDYDRMIHTARWLKLRREKLMASPACERCGRPAREVHHITPAETATNKASMEELMFNYSNLKSLCHECHVQEHRELGSKSKEVNVERKRKDAEDFIARFMQ